MRMETRISWGPRRPIIARPLKKRDERESLRKRGRKSGRTLSSYDTISEGVCLHCVAFRRYISSSVHRSKWTQIAGEAGEEKLGGRNSEL